MSTKGGKFEREMCKLLSLWWSDGQNDDDLLWRTSNSGGRATARRKQGKRTRGHNGDVCATHPSAEPLIKCLTIELKRGYNIFTFADMIDTPGKAVQEWESWHKQAVESHCQAGSLSWLIVQRRDKRRAIAFFPDDFLKLLHRFGCLAETPYPSATIRFASQDGLTHKVHCMLLDDFLAEVSPQDIRSIVAEAT